MAATLFAREEHRGVTITVFLKDTRAVAALCRGACVEHHVIESNPLKAASLTARQAMTRAKGLLQ